MFSCLNKMAQNYCMLSFLTTLESNNYRVSYRLLTSYQHWTRMDRDHEGPYSGYLYGSNDGFSTFQEIHRFAAITLPTTSGGVKYLHTVSSSYTPSGSPSHTSIVLVPKLAT